MQTVLEERLGRQNGIPAKGLLRIALIAPYLNKRATGLSTYIAELAPQLCDAGHQVSIIGADCGYRGEEAGELIEVDSRANLRVFPVRGKLNRRLYRSAEMSRWLISNVREFDVVDIQTVWTLIAVDAARACLSAGVPYVLTPHGSMTRWDWSKKRNFKRIFFATLLRKVWGSASAIRFLSNGELANSMVAPKAPVAVIPNAVPVPAGEKSDTAARNICARLNLPEKAQIVLFLGRVTHQKGVVELLQAFALIQERCPDAYLVVAGPFDGEYGEMVRKICALNARVRLLGPVFGEEKYDLFKASTLFVTLTRNEGLPIAALEALSFGVPVVLTADANLPEVEDFGVGTITTCEPERAARDIASMLLNPVQLSRMRGSARRMVEQRFSWDFVLPRLIELYQRAAGKPASDGELSQKIAS
jgi:glycosyltransferase involved in cell wall biosynthesis